jgi:hypothetical protein
MKKAILAFALGASIVTAAGAQDMPRGPGAAMMRADANGDGVVTRAEALAEAGVRFDRIDANRDGKIDQAELAAMPMRRGRGGDTPPAPAPTPVK